MCLKTNLPPLYFESINLLSGPSKIVDGILVNRTVTSNSK